MPMSQAMRRCPDLVVVSAHFEAYRQASKQVMARLHALTPLVEQLSIDEAFMDVSALAADSETIARQLQQTINHELDLPCSVGVASNKLVAKIANNVGKSAAQGGQPPNAITVVLDGWEAAYLAPLPVRELWGVGPKTAEQLETLGLYTIGDIAQQPAESLGQRFGKHGYDLARRAQGIDTRPVQTERETKSISQERTFAVDVRDEAELRRLIERLSAEVSRRLQQHALQGTTIKIKLRWADFTTLTRQMTLPQPTDQADPISRVALQLFEQTWSKNQSVRLVGVGISGFERPAYHQLPLWPLEETVKEVV